VQPKQIAAMGTVLLWLGWCAIVIGLLGTGFTLVTTVHWSEFFPPQPSGSGATLPTSPPVEAPIIVARRIIPGIVDRVYKALDGGTPSSLQSVLSPRAQNNFQLFDAICRPYTYRAHYIENIVEGPYNMVEVWVRVLFKPIDEHAYVLTFQNQGGSLVLDQVHDPPPNWFDEQKERAAELVHQFVSAAQAGRVDVLSHLVTADLPTAAFMTDPCWQLQLHHFSYQVPRVDQITLRSYKGLKTEVNVSGPGTFLVEPINGEYKIVGAFLMFGSTYMASDQTCNDVSRMRGAEDPNLETRTLERFHLRGGQ
jgi:hypothetical protein